MRNKLRLTENVLNELGLAGSANKYPTLEQAAVSMSVSRDAAKAKRLLEIIHIPDEPAVALEKGTLLGFPQTAVEAYSNSLQGGESSFIAWKDIPQDIREADFMAFSPGVIFSKKHMTTEIAELKGWAEAVQDMHPALYASVVKAHKEAETLRKKETLRKN